MANKIHHISNNIKLILLAVSIIILSLFSFGCNSISSQTTESTAIPSKTPEEQLKEDYNNNPAAYVEFYRSTEPKYTYVSIEDILEYESLYSECTGTWFRDQLSGEDLCIYNSYLYAMEHRYIWFTIYVEDSDKDFSYIRDSVCLDSPFLAQNKNQLGEWSDKWPINYIGESIYISVEQFTESRWQRNMEALEKCKEIVTNIPDEYITKEDKMLYLYNYVCDNVEYVAYENMMDEDYLYDAVCKGETVCDGYSNMLSLLFNLIDVECTEAMGSDIEDISQATAEEIKNNPGHTWVVAKLNNTFYNFDPTFEDTDEEYSDDRLFYFGFSDNLLPVKYLTLDESRPKCLDTSRDYNYVNTTYIK